MPSPPTSPTPVHTARDARAIGQRLHDDPAFARIRSGAYVGRDAWEELAPWDRYLVRVHAFASQHPDAVFGFESAAALSGMPLFGEPRDIHVFDDRRSRSRRFGDVCVHTSQQTREIVKLDGLRLTAPAETIADLVRVLPPAFGLALADAVVAPRQLALASPEEVRAVTGRRIDPRGRERARWVLHELDPRAESVGESVSRAVMLWLGFARPVLQQVFHFEGVEDRTDFWWPDVRAVGESDGYSKYAAGTADATVERMVREKRREDRLRRHVHGFARWDMAGAQRVSPLRSALLQAGVPLVARPQSAFLSTLRSHPRSRHPINEKPLPRP
jgi:hypothetical protein